MPAANGLSGFAQRSRARYCTELGRTTIPAFDQFRGGIHWGCNGESRFTSFVVNSNTLKAEIGHSARSDSREFAMYLLGAAACLAFWCYEKMIVHTDGTYPNAMLAAALLATALHMLKTAEIT